MNIESLKLTLTVQLQTNTRRLKEKKTKKKHYRKSSYVQRVISIGGLYLVERNEEIFFEKSKKKNERKNNQQQQLSVFSLLLLCHYLFSNLIIFVFHFKITLNSITLFHCFLPYPISTFA